MTNTNTNTDTTNICLYQVTSLTTGTDPVEYVDRVDAELAALELDDFASVVELPVAITGVTAWQTRDGDVAVSARVSVMGRQIDTRWSARPTRRAIADYGLEPAGDCIDAWTDHQLASLLSSDALVAIGEEVLARAEVRS